MEWKDNKFVFDNDKPIYMQLVENIKKKIISGELELGERIPSVRELATILKVNPNTMQKALQELESLELIFTERTNGKFVTENRKIINKYKDVYADNLIKDFMSNMIEIGYKKDEIIEIINKVKEMN